MTYELVRYFASGVDPHVTEKWCLDKKVHVGRKAVYMPFGGGWQTLETHLIGDCDGDDCERFETTDGVETRTEPIDHEAIVRLDYSELPSAFKEYVCVEK